MRWHWSFTVAPFLIGLVVVLLTLLPIACSSTSKCKTSTSPGCNVVNALVDCTGVKTLDAAVAEATPQVISIVDSARSSDGSINWSGIEDKLVQLAWKYGMCVVAEIWNDYFGTVPPAPPGDAGVGSGAVATKLKLTTDPTAARAAFDQIRAKVAPGHSFKVKGGVL